jgi:hypothetical protein
MKTETESEMFAGKMEIGNIENGEQYNTVGCMPITVRTDNLNGKDFFLDQRHLAQLILKA